MTPELKELYRQTIAQKDREIADLKARINALEAELQRPERMDSTLRPDVIINPVTPTVTA